MYVLGKPTTRRSSNDMPAAAAMLCCAVEYEHVASAQCYMRERWHPRGTESFGIPAELSGTDKLWRLSKRLALPLFDVFGLCFIARREKAQ